MRYLAKLLWQMGYYGEAYRAAAALPPAELDDCAPIFKAVEVDEVLASSRLFNFEIITLCNLRCPMCSHGVNVEGNHKTYAAKGQIMSLADFRKIWKEIGPRVKLLVLVGQGETFMHPNIYDILDHVAPTPVYIDTNANIKLDAERVVKSSLQSLVFSIDGVDQRTYEQYRIGGDFQKAIENVKAVAAAKKKLGRGPELRFKYIIFKHNEAYYEEAETMIRDLGVDTKQIVPCLTEPRHGEVLVRRFFPHGRLRRLSRISGIDYGREALIMSAGHESPHCLAAMNNPNVQVDGRLTPCCSAMTEYMGNLLEQNYDDIWRSARYREFRLAALRNRYENEACQKCSRDQNNLGRLFDGTELESAGRPEPTDNIFNLEDLRVEADYAARLLEQGLQKDIDYYRESGVLSPEAELLLKQPARA